MLVLTRKTDEQILIGDDIRITLVKVRGNSVRLGIDAPKNMRVVRGELMRLENAELPDPVVEREEVFACPESQHKHSGSSSRISDAMRDEQDASCEKLASSVSATSNARMVQPASAAKSAPAKRAPLSSFVSAS